MSIKDKILNMLALEVPEGLSDEKIASELGVSCASVWKSIQRLQEEGYVIEGVCNKGYKMIGKYDPLTKRGIVNSFSDCFRNQVALHVLETVDSTNAYLKKLAREGAPELTCVIAEEQLAGKGRRGRSFASPKGSGIYLSILAKPPIELDKTGFLTGAAAVAVCNAIEECVSTNPQIKWVNDIYLNERKVCGILTEGSVDLETGRLAYAVIGIGINVYNPEEGWPEEIANRAGAISPDLRSGLRNELTARIIEECCSIIYSGNYSEVARRYQKYSLMTNREVSVLQDDGTIVPAFSLGVNDDLSLLVKYADGREESLNTGEVSIKL